MEKVLVTGGAGFIGSRFVKALNMFHPDWEVIVLDKLTYAADLNRLKGLMYTLIEDDINNIENIMDTVGDCTYVVNFAAETHVDNSIEDGNPFIQTNAMGTFALIKAFLKSKNLKKFVQISTDEVYGDLQDYSSKDSRFRGSHEGYPINPSSFYSASKAASDLFVMSAGRTFNFPYLITRACNNFGPNQHEEKFIPKLIQRMLDGKPFPLYGDGNHYREWINVDLHAYTILHLMKNVEKRQDIFNVGTGDLRSNKEIVLTASDTCPNLDTRSAKDRLGHDKLYMLDSGKVNSFLSHGRVNFDKYLNSAYSSNVLEDSVTDFVKFEYNIKKHKGV
jgi:dTDP-glucose 4,6-dehydratase